MPWLSFCTTLCTKQHMLAYMFARACVLTRGAACLALKLKMRTRKKQRRRRAHRLRCWIWREWYHWPKTSAIIPGSVCFALLVMFRRSKLWEDLNRRWYCRNLWAISACQNAPNCTNFNIFRSDTSEAPEAHGAYTSPLSRPATNPQLWNPWTWLASHLIM